MIRLKEKVREKMRAESTLNKTLKSKKSASNIEPLDLRSRSVI